MHAGYLVQTLFSLRDPCPGVYSFTFVHFGAREEKVIYVRDTVKRTKEARDMEKRQRAELLAMLDSGRIRIENLLNNLNDLEIEGVDDLMDDMFGL